MLARGRTQTDRAWHVIDRIPEVGTWARIDDFVGLVAAIEGDAVTVFDPGARQQRRAPTAQVTVLPAAAVRVTMHVDLPIPHGLPEVSLRRWVALLADPVLRERAAGAMVETGLDEGAAAPPVEFDARALADGLARCLCGATTTTDPGVPVRCATCGRQAAPPIAPPA